MTDPAAPRRVDVARYRAAVWAQLEAQLADVDAAVATLEVPADARHAAAAREAVVEVRHMIGTKAMPNNHRAS